MVVRTANLLSMELEWVKLLPDDYARGKLMYKWLLSVLLVLMSTVVHAADCFDLAGRDYKIDRIYCGRFHGRNPVTGLMPSVLIRLRIWLGVNAG